MKRLYINTIPIIIALGVFLLFVAMMTNSVAGQRAISKNGAYITLTTDNVITWRFQAEQQGLYALQLWLAEKAPSGSTLVVNLTSPTNLDIPATEVRLELDKFRDSEAVLAQFKPVWILPSSRLAQTSFEIQLLLHGSSSDTVIMFQAGSDSTIEQELVPAFVPLYQTRQLDRVWPISKMAAARPGVFGWPPFYAILAYAFLVLLFYVILGIWKPSQRQPRP